MGKKQIKNGHGWAWSFRNADGSIVLCNWAEPYKAVLIKNQKPSPESKPIYCAIVPMVQYRMLKTAAKR